MQTYLDCYLNVMALYCALQALPVRSIRKAELNQTGEVKPEVVDFIADVEIKVKRVLGPALFRDFMLIVAEEKYQQLNVFIQSLLGQTFLKNNLNYDGDYRVLYFQAKNERLHDEIERDRPSFPEER